MDSRWLVRTLDVGINRRDLRSLACMAMSKDPQSPDLMYALGYNDSISSAVRIFSVKTGVELPGIQYRADAAAFNWIGEFMVPNRVKTLPDSILLLDLYHRGFAQINLTNSLWIQAWRSTDAFLFDTDVDAARDRIIVMGGSNSRPTNGPYFLAWYPINSNITLLSVPLYNVNPYSDSVAVSSQTGNVFVSSAFGQSVREYTADELVLLREIMMESQMTDIYTELLVNSHNWLIVSIQNGIWYCIGDDAPALLPTGGVQTIKTRGALAVASDGELIFLAPSTASNESSLLLGVSPAEQESNHLSAGVIAAITIGVVAFLLLVTVAVAYLLRRRSAREAHPVINELMAHMQ